MVSCRSQIAARSGEADKGLPGGETFSRAVWLLGWPLKSSDTPPLFKAEYREVTASCSEWEANRVVLARQAFCVRWTRRPRNERASTTIARVRGGAVRGPFIF